jgi:putative SOS response-associated peptidase YedK
MCGRFALRTSPRKLAREFNVEDAPQTEARYNIAPTQTVLAVRREPDGRAIGLLKWGLVPSWAKDESIGAKLINARSETVLEKPSFREAFKRRRCIIPADGFYEWQRAGKSKQPYYFRLNEERPFGFAGLWEKWKTASGALLETCAILTTEANELLRPVHERMPVILHREDYDLWLEDDPRKLDFVKELLRPYPASEMVSYPVGAEVNNPGRVGEDLIKPLERNSA